MGGGGSKGEDIDGDVVLGKRTTAIEAAQHAVSGLGHNLAEDVFIVTGASSGIGQETARVLAHEAATVILACRNEEKGKQVEAEIRKESQNDKVHFMQLNLASFRSIEQFAAAFQERELPLRALINNAGVNMPSLQYTDDGYEMTFGVNVLGPFYLTSLLLDRLKASVPSRVVNLSSMSHQFGSFDVSLLPPGKFSSFGTYTGLQQYFTSKICVNLFSHCLNRRNQEFGVTSYALNPGDIKTQLLRDHGLLKAGAVLVSPLLKSIPQGAATTIYCSTDPDALANAGKYFQDCAVFEDLALCRDEKNQDALWDLLTNLVDNQLHRKDEAEIDAIDEAIRTSPDEQGYHL